MNTTSTISHSIVYSGNLPLHVAAAGSGELILLLHGFPECWYSWRHVLYDLGKDFHVVAPDGRGYNESGKPESPELYSMDQICDDLRALLAHYDAKKCTLVGHDWGGVVAWYFAARHPDLVERLVIINAPHPNLFQRALHHDLAQRTASQYITRLRDPGCEARLLSAGLEQFWSTTFGDLEKKGIVSAVDKSVYLNAWSKPGALTGMLNWYRASQFIVPPVNDSLNPTPSTDIEQIYIPMPTMVIWGEQDTILLPSLLHELDKYVPHLTIHKIAAGHGIIHEEPVQVNALIRQFISSTSTG